MTTLPSPGAALRIAALTGNPKPASRTHLVVSTVTRTLADSLAAEIVADIDLGDWQGGPFTALPDRIASATEVLLTADVVVVGTPVYKGSYTGLLKGLLDVLPPGALRRAVVVPVTVSAAPSHKLLAEHALRPVIAELGASLPVPGLALEEPQLASLDAHVETWLEKYGDTVAAVARTLANATGAAQTAGAA
jgi:FMN reductase